MVRVGCVKVREVFGWVGKPVALRDVVRMDAGWLFVRLVQVHNYT